MKPRNTQPLETFQFHEAVRADEPLDLNPELSNSTKDTSAVNSLKKTDRMMISRKRWDRVKGQDVRCGGHLQDQFFNTKAHATAHVTAHTKAHTTAHTRAHATAHKDSFA